MEGNQSNIKEDYIDEKRTNEAVIDINQSSREEDVIERNQSNTEEVFVDGNQGSAGENVIDRTQASNPLHLENSVAEKSHTVQSPSYHVLNTRPKTSLQIPKRVISQDTFTRKPSISHSITFPHAPSIAPPRKPTKSLLSNRSKLDQPPFRVGSTILVESGPVRRTSSSCDVSPKPSEKPVPSPPRQPMSPKAREAVKRRSHARAYDNYLMAGTTTASYNGLDGNGAIEYIPLRDDDLLTSRPETRLEFFDDNDDDEDYGDASGSFSRFPSEHSEDLIPTRGSTSEGAEGGVECDALGKFSMPPLERQDSNSSQDSAGSPRRVSFKGLVAVKEIYYDDVEKSLSPRLDTIQERRSGPQSPVGKPRASSTLEKMPPVGSRPWR